MNQAFDCCAGNRPAWRGWNPDCITFPSRRDFGSLYEVQEGSHLNKPMSDMKTAGYAVA